MTNVLFTTPLIPNNNTPGGVWIEVNIAKQIDGTVVLMNAAGESISVQEDGSIQTRAPGSAGVFERAMLSGNTVTYYPASGKYYVFSIFGLRP
jgi:hypothetical protein